MKKNNLPQNVNNNSQVHSGTQFRTHSRGPMKFFRILEVFSRGNSSEILPKS